MRGMCGEGRRGATDTSGLGQPDREFRVTPGNKARTTAQPHHAPDSGKGRENDSVAPRAPESLAGALKSRFPHTRGRGRVTQAETAQVGRQALSPPESSPYSCHTFQQTSAYICLTPVPCGGTGKMAAGPSPPLPCQPGWGQCGPCSWDGI